MLIVACRSERLSLSCLILGNMFFSSPTFLSVELILPLHVSF